MTRIATREEVADLFAGLFQPPTIELAQGGNAINASYGGDPIVFKRGASVPVRRSTHSAR